MDVTLKSLCCFATTYTRFNVTFSALNLTLKKTGCRIEFSECQTQISQCLTQVPEIFQLAAADQPVSPPSEDMHGMSKLYRWSALVGTIGMPHSPSFH